MAFGCLFLLSFVTLTTCHGFVIPTTHFHHRRQDDDTVPAPRIIISIIIGMTQQDNDDDKEEEPIFYDDFEDFSTLSSSSNDETSSRFSLQNRMAQIQQERNQEAARMTQNWKDGQWSVRGCSLDPGGGDDDEDIRIQVTSLYPLLSSNSDEESMVPQLVLVGRSNGSLIWLQVSPLLDGVPETETEYLTTFTNQPVAKHIAKDNATVLTTELKENKGSSNSGVMGGDKDDDGSVWSRKSPFAILSQLQVSHDNAAIVDMALTGGPSEDGGADTPTTLVVALDNGKLVRIALQDEDEDHLPITEKDPIEELEVPYSYGEGMPTSPPLPLVGLHAVPSLNGILAVYGNGQVVIFYNGGQSQSVSSLQLGLSEYEENVVVDGTFVSSCDVDEKHLYVGTLSGEVQIYDIGAMRTEQDTIPPILSFSVSPKYGVSAILAAGPGSMGQNRPGRTTTTTMALVTGTTDGTIQQWELIPTGAQRFQHWPKMASQRMPGKAHLFRKQNDDTIRHLQFVQGKQVLLSANSHQLTLWNPETGESWLDMDGLEFDADPSTSTRMWKPSCVVIGAQDQWLLTNGMKHYVCLHDFSMTPILMEGDDSSSNVQDYLQDLDGEQDED